MNSFRESMKNSIKFSFSGKLSRSDNLTFNFVMLGFIILLFVIFISTIMSIDFSSAMTDISSITSDTRFIVASVVFIIFVLLISILSASATVRRLHDLNHSGWLYLIMFVPYINMIFMFYVVFAKSKSESEIKIEKESEYEYRKVLKELKTKITVLLCSIKDKFQ